MATNTKVMSKFLVTQMRLQNFSIKFHCSLLFLCVFYSSQINLGPLLIIIVFVLGNVRMELLIKFKQEMGLYFYAMSETF